MSTNGHVFTSESVGPGHPDKLCDQISDSILDACLANDPQSRVACEVLATKNLIVLAGEITTKSKVDYVAIARQLLREVGYSNEAYGINADTCEVLNVIKEQSPEIGAAVTHEGAGDQGLMFGYATDETPGYMPLPIYLAHRLMEEANRQRLTGDFLYARPDMKSQVTIDYRGSKPRIHTMLMSVQHDGNYDENQFKAHILDKIMKKIAIENNLNTDFISIINPSGSFIIGGPEGDTGLTGRKIIVDTYGGYARHGGGAFSGKDYTKVDRSAAYAARWIAKNVVAAKLAKECEIQLSYAIGQKEPISLLVDTFGTGVLDDSLLEAFILKHYELSPRWIVQTLKLDRPIYKETATFGHFGRNLPNFTWEKLDLVDELKKLII